MVERKVTIKINTQIDNFKEKTKKDITQIINNYKNNPNCDIDNLLLEYLEGVYNNKIIHLDTNDFKKRKRAKNIVPLHDRCIALRACNDQCTRRKKEGYDFCGTHIKGNIHGSIVNKEPIVKTTSVWAEDICGIIYYIDNNNNVYNTEEIITNKPSPSIIAKYEMYYDEKKNKNIYSIPEFNI